VLQAETAVIDGAVVVLDRHGVSRFARLKEELSGGVAEPLLVYALNLLQLDGQDLRDLPLLELKRQLEMLRAPLPLDCPIRFSEHLTGRGPEMHRHA
jgi:bifunctional non-homologous end joining protein LigD